MRNPLAASRHASEATTLILMLREIAYEVSTPQYRRVEKE